MVWPAAPKLPGIMEKSLRRAALWDEVRDKLNDSAHALSGGQQQRLFFIARGLAVDPEVLLLDEPMFGAFDPIATAKIEDLLVGLKKQCTIVIVAYNMQQAARVADNNKLLPCWMPAGDEHDRTDVIFKNLSQKETEDYITEIAFRLEMGFSCPLPPPPPPPPPRPPTRVYSPN